MKSDSLGLNRVAVWLLWVVFFALLYCVWLIYKIYIFPLFIALISYLVLRKPHHYLFKALRGRKNLASLSTSLLAILLIVFPAFYLMKTLVGEILVTIGHVQSWLTQENLSRFYQKNAWLRQFVEYFDLEIDNIQENLLNMTKNLGSALFQQGREIISGVFSIFFNLILSIVVLFFLFREGDKLPSIIYRLLPFPDSIEKEVGGRLISVLDVMVKSTGYVLLMHGFAVSLYFWLFGLSTPILYGAIAAIFSLVPILGTAPVWLLGALYLYWNGQVLASIFFSILCFLTYLGFENIIKPLLLDKKLPLHPLFIFLALLGGVIQFGIKGLILGPFAVIAFLIVFELMKTWVLEYERK